MLDKNSALVRNTLLMSIGQSFRMLIQAIYFVLIAKSLGPDEYGAFIGVIALVTIFSPFSGLGSGNLLIKNVSRNPKLFGDYWGKCLLVTAVSGFILVLFLILLSKYAIPKTITSLYILFLSISEIIFVRILDLSGQAFQAYQKLGWTAFIQISLSLSRLIAAILFYSLITNHTANLWAVFYFISTIIASVIGLLSVTLVLGSPRYQLKIYKNEIKEGIYFTIGSSAENIYNDIDKTMLSKLTTLEIAGIYSTAYRLIEVSFTPILSLIRASYAKFFQHGVKGIKNTFYFAKRLIIFSSFYTMIAGIIIFFAAPYIPYVLGNEYSSSVEVLRWLCFLPILKASNNFAANILTSSNYQSLRTLIQIFASIIHVVITYFLIVKHYWLGAVIGSYTTNLILSCSFWSVILVLMAKENLASRKLNVS